MYIPTAKDPKAAGWNPPPLGPFLLALLAAFLLVLLGSSCSPQNRMAKLMDKNPGIAAVECEDRFPVLETRDTTVIQDTALLLAYEKEFAYLNQLLDSLLSIGCDPVIVEKIKEINLPSKPCPETRINTTKESTARLDTLKRGYEKRMSQILQQFATKEKSLRSQIETSKSQIAKCEQERDKAVTKLDRIKKQRNTYLCLLILLLGWTFRKPLLKAIRLLTIKI